MSSRFRFYNRFAGAGSNFGTIVDAELIELFIAPISAPGECVSRGDLGEGKK